MVLLVEILKFYSIMSIIDRIKYVCAMFGLIMGILGPIDMVFNIGIIDFFMSSWIFLLAIPFWVIAHWIQEFFPLNSDGD